MIWTDVNLTGEYELAADRESVWLALNSEQVLAQCIPGCTRFVRLADDRFDMQIGARIGPVSASFDGQVALKEIHAPESYRLLGSLSAGPMGFAKGNASVVLTPGGKGTVLRYEVAADTGGRIAQIGSRVVDAVSAKLAAQFFDRFASQVAELHPAAASAGDHPQFLARTVAGGATHSRALRTLRWGFGVAIVVLVVATYFLLGRI